MAARQPTFTPSRAPLPSRAARHAPPPDRSRLKRILRWALWFAVPLLAVLAGSLVGLVYAFAKVPVLDQVPAAQTTVFLDRKGAEIGTLSPNENRRIVPFAQIPDVMKHAVLAAEDRDFYKHGAISYRGMLRATLANVRNAGVSQGGSTITQQYVKNAYPSVGRSRNLFRKLKEAVIAVKLEKKYSKDQILGFYLNTVYFGKGAYGVDAASRAFFNRPARKLTLSQAALLAATIRAPEFYSKQQNATSAKARRNFVLQVMLDRQWITEKQATAAMKAPVKENWSAPSTGIAKSKAPYFLEMVRQYLEHKYGLARMEQGGFRVQTTIDLGMQRDAEEAVKSTLDHTGDPKAALVALDPKTGAVRALYGGRDFVKEPLNYATAMRQAGSTMKPFVLEEALQEGYSVNSVFPGPNKLEIQGHEYSNFGTESFGDITLMDATRHSVNTVYVKLIEKLGPQRVAELAHRTGLDDLIDRTDKSSERKPRLEPVIPLALGASDVSTLQLASAYGTWANQGVHHEAYMVERVTDSTGRVLERHRDAGRQIIDPNLANTITLALRGVVEGGTGTAARLPDRMVAGKTGTTNDSVDARFVGYDSNLVTSVWMGYENRKTRRPLRNVHGIREVSGGSLPATIWRLFMRAATEGLPPQPFPQPLITGIVLNPTTTTSTTTTTTTPPPPQPTVTQPTLPPQTTLPPQQQVPSSTFAQQFPTTTVAPGPGATNEAAPGQGGTRSTDPPDSG